MPSLVLVVALYLASAVHGYLRHYAPSNLLMAHVRRNRPRLRVVGALFALVAALQFAALALSERVGSGGARWLYLVAITAIWDSLKVAVLTLALVMRCFVATSHPRASTDVTDLGRGAHG